MVRATVANVRAAVSVEIENENELRPYCTAREVLD